MPVPSPVAYPPPSSTHFRAATSQGRHPAPMRLAPSRPPHGASEALEAVPSPPRVATRLTVGQTNPQGPHRRGACHGFSYRPGPEPSRWAEGRAACKGPRVVDCCRLAGGAAEAALQPPPSVARAARSGNYLTTYLYLWALRPPLRPPYSPYGPTSDRSHGLAGLTTILVIFFSSPCSVLLPPLVRKQ